MQGKRTRGPALRQSVSYAIVWMGGQGSSLGETVPLFIGNEEICRAARELARIRGSTITDAVAGALQEALRRERNRRSLRQADLVAALDEIALHCAGLPLVDSRSPEQIIDYGGDGLPR